MRTRAFVAVLSLIAASVVTFNVAGCKQHMHSADEYAEYDGSYHYYYCSDCNVYVREEHNILDGACLSCGMKEKSASDRIVLICVDGLRPDAIAENKTAKKLIEGGVSCLNAKTVYPCLTLPAHISLFHSVTPTVHGTTDNNYVLPERPIPGLVETLSSARKTCAAIFGWGEIHDIEPMGTFDYNAYYSGGKRGYNVSDGMSLTTAQSILKYESYDFVFLYFGNTDSVGHSFGWMSSEYINAVNQCIEDIDWLIHEFGDKYSFIITADHGGHSNYHGDDIAEDMTIPLIMYGPEFKAGKVLQDADIRDVAPTIASFMQAELPAEWQGSVLDYK